MSVSHYKLRITWSKTSTTPEDVMKVFHSSDIDYASVDERGGIEKSPHTHFYLLVPIKEPVLRKRLRDVVGKSNTGSKGQAIYSLGKLDIGDELFASEYLAYMCKEGNVLLSDKFSEDWLSQSIILDKAVKDDMKTKKDDKKKNKFTKICDGVFALRDANEYDIDQRQVIDFVIKYHDDNNLTFSINGLASLVDRIMMKLYPSYITNIASRICRVLNPYKIL